MAAADPEVPGLNVMTAASHFSPPRAQGRQAILVCGAHRSGTTWLGSILSQEVDTVSLYEPLHREVGIRGVDHWYPAADPYAPGPYDRLLDRFVAGGARYRPPYAARKWMRPVKRILRGNDEERLYRRVQQERPSRLVIKDPHATLSARYLAVTHGMQVVCIVRHPAAFANSVSRMGWSARPHLADLYRQKALQWAFAPMTWRDISRLSSIEQAGLLWRIVNQHVVELMRTPDVSAVCIRHEDLCREPLATLGTVTSGLRITAGPATLAYLDETTHGDQAEGPDGQQHALVRRSADVPAVWKGRFDRPALDAIRAYAEPVAGLFYSDADWEI